MQKKENWRALLPIGVFLVMYLGLGILFEYVMKIPMGFYNIPIVVSFLTALLVACLQNPKVSFDEKLELMAKGVGDKNILTMILIFMTAGIFVGVVGRSSAESVAYFLLSIIPERFSVVVLFLVSCFVSLAMGTSVGAITLITPHCSGSVKWFGLWHFAVHRRCYGRSNVRGQPLLYIRHNHSCLQWPRLPDEGQIPRELWNRISCRPCYSYHYSDKNSGL